MNRMRAPPPATSPPRWTSTVLDRRLFHLMMRRVSDACPDVHFARPVPGDPPSASCDMGLTRTLRLLCLRLRLRLPHGHHQGYSRFAIANALELTLCLAAT
nr:uncharacterized protein LOC127316903 [Lolium perenne]